MPQSQSSSKPVFFEGQRALGDMLFAKGGPFEALLSGGPDVGFEAGAARSQQTLNENLAGQGLAGQPLAAKAQVDFQSQVAQGRESNRLETLLNAVQPSGTRGASKSGPLSSLSM